jgi:glucokinase
MDYAIGIDLGGSSVKAVAAGLDGRVLRRENREFNPERQLDFARTVRAVFQEIQEHQGGPAACCGVAAPGLAARDGSAIAFMPGRLEGLEGLHWGEFLGFPAVIPVMNDAHAALLGENWAGAAKGLANVIMLTLGTGVGGAAIVDGRLLAGSIGRAGHFGHSCLDMAGPPDITGIPGSLEYLMGNYSIPERTRGRFPTTHALVQACAAGDAEAGRIWRDSIRALACGIATFINLFDPEAVIIGGGIARAGSALFEPLEKELRKIEWHPGGYNVKLVRAELGEFAGAIGSACNAVQKMRSPLKGE